MGKIIGYVLLAFLGCILDLYYCQRRGAGEGAGVQFQKKFLWPQTTKAGILFVLVLAVSLLLAIVLGLYETDDSWVFQCKRIWLIMVLWGVAWTDFSEHLIPNDLLKVALGCWGILTLLEAVFFRQEFLRYVPRELFFAVAIMAFMLILRLITKDGIGMGDVKLMMVMALFQGGKGLISSVMTSLIILFFVSVILLLTKKKGRKDVIPFAPAICAGTYLSIILTGV